jgi:hypothetical protein
MGMGFYISGFETFGYHTETAGTSIDEKVQAQNNKRLCLAALSYLCAGTAHTISFMYSKDFTAGSGSSRNTTSAAAAAAQAVVNVTNTPLDCAGNAAAANDIVAYQCSDGTWEFNTIASVATKAITLNNNLSKAVLIGAKFLILGVVGDNVSLKLKGTASVQKDWVAYGVPILVHPYIGEPFFVTSDNSAAAGFLQNMGFVHGDK